MAVKVLTPKEEASALEALREIGQSIDQLREDAKMMAAALVVTSRLVGVHPRTKAEIDRVKEVLNAFIDYRFAAYGNDDMLAIAIISQAFPKRYDDMLISGQLDREKWMERVK